jgi:membrane protein YdbS with pleckstrin-like domain
MQTRTFIPNARYLTKLRLIITIVALLVLAGGALLGWLISHDKTVDESDVILIYLIVAVADLLWYVPALILSGPYFRSLSYEIQDDEVIVRVGIWTQSVKHVPYRTVTNLAVKRDILDRGFFGLGTLNIQTAGMSGKTGAEESLVGLPNVQEVYDIVVTELRRFRGSMAPTAADVEDESILSSADALSAILGEVRAIRQALETE